MSEWTKYMKDEFPDEAKKDSNKSIRVNRKEQYTTTIDSAVADVVVHNRLNLAIYVKISHNLSHNLIIELRTQE